MGKINISFCIDEKKYRLFVEKRIFHFEVYLFQELDTGFLKSMKVKEISASTVTDSTKHWLMEKKLKLCQKTKRWKWMQTVKVQTEVAGVKRTSCRTCIHNKRCMERSRGYPCRNYQRKEN